MAEPAAKRAKKLDFPAYAPPAGKPTRTSNLREALRDPPATSTYASDEVVRFIYDGYPKARVHLLALAPPGSPLRDVKSVKDLRPKHLEALRAFHARCEECARSLPEESVRIGYHAEPSMNWLHCHVISTDFDSTCLKTKQHWNSFMTDFFVPADEVERLLETDDDAFGTALRTDLAARAKHEKDDLRCHRCLKPQKNMPALKAHILACTTY
ncbi:hypothetical protein CTAYLR_005344 [Chrysophaeum taylorii]|uniref:Aprataxin C2HE/C2H2/C2HC zinc finger domain-containing protein n=1 Tax=Chrysophaeum taylorii TaxID=2483200 RepID=A0AAD7XHA4_9STRA|nr:hypothetical protein CTAYLR_005344 [Chrysophaeum taylorii]